MRLTVFAVVAFGLLPLAFCDLGLGRSFSIINQSDTDISVAYESEAREGYVVQEQLSWYSVPAGEEAGLPQGGFPRCLSSGTMLVAAKPDRSAVIDRRDLTEEPWCFNDPWEWSGPQQDE